MKHLPVTQKDFQFVKWTKEDIENLLEPTLSALTIDYTSIIHIPKNERSYENTVLPLEFAGGVYADIPHKVDLLFNVSVSEEVRKAAMAFGEAYGERVIEILHNKDVYLALKEYENGNWKKEKKSLPPEYVKHFVDVMRVYARMGFDLSPKDQTKLQKLKQKLSKLSIEFSHNINSYTDHIILTPQDLDGLSKEYIAGLKKNAEGNYIVTLEYPDYVPFMSQSSRADLRKKLALKYEAKGGKRNLSILKQIIELRKQIAQLLGFALYADLKLEDRMAKNYKSASTFIDSLIKKVQKPAKQDLELLTEEKRRATGNARDTLELFDTSYYACQYKMRVFDIDSEKLRPWFPFNHVRETMFAFFGEFLGITVLKENFKLWHKDAEAFKIIDTKSGEVLGYLLLDMFPRQGKYGHACMVPLIDGHRAKDGESRVLPIAALLCNFPNPKSSKPSLLSLGEVGTLFHEFGHALHHLLSRTELASQAGTNVAWDFVETPSQMPENFLWSKDLLAQLSKHYKDGSSLDEKIIERLILNKDFLAAWSAQRQLIFARFDLDIHTQDIKDTSAYFKELYQKITGTPYLKQSLFPASFGHLMGYDAGYYSYMWALVYAQDIYAECVNTHKKLKEGAGARYRREILERGSSRKEIDSVTAFLGRQVDTTAFLESIGVSIKKIRT